MSEFEEGDPYGMEDDMGMDQDQMEEYDQEMMGEYDENMEDMGDENMDQMEDDMNEDGYGAEEDDQSINFEENPEYAHMPPLDRLRKIRRAILKTINDVRQAHGSPNIFIDLNANKAANEYAEYLLTNGESQEKVDELCGQNRILGHVLPLVGFAILEEDEDQHGTLHDQFMDAHGLLLELEYELKVLTDPKNSHIGIGFAFTKEQVKVVELVAEKPMMVSQLGQSEDGGVEARGSILVKEVGLYAVRVASLAKMNKDIKVVGPSAIKFDRSTGEFVVHIPGPFDNLFYNNEDPKVIEFFISRRQADKIQYGVDTGERINVTQLEKCFSFAAEFIPDPRTVIEDAADFEKELKDREIRKRREEELALQKQAQKVARKAEREKQMNAMIEAKGEGDEQQSQEDSQQSGSKKTKSKKQGHESESKAGSGDNMKSKDGMSASEDEDYGEESEGSDMAELPSQQEMRRDLIQAIEEELREQDQLRRENENLQKEIINMDTNIDQQQNEVQPNENKYLNTLANVHQVRINLKETQDRYNKMASELQAKLNEKQAKCHEIEQQFKELKRSVAQNAVFSRTGKKIPKKTLDEWEEAESLRDQEVHQYRLQNIALRNRLANKEKILKKKEQLADGLHLIDFEQLKIENQTLNEKIEERNEELDKLREKITKNVVIISHTREKLQFVLKQNSDQQVLLNDLKEQLNEKKNIQSKLKKNREKLQKINLKLKQQTGIVNKKELQQDYEKRHDEKKELIVKIKELRLTHRKLSSIIKQANNIQMKNM